MSNHKKELKRVAERAIAGAQKMGIKDVRATANRSRAVSVTYRGGRPEKVTESTQRGLSLALYIDGKYTSCSTNDLRDSAVDSFLGSAVAMCKAMTPDEFREITDSKLYEGRQEKNLQLYDESVQSVTPEQRHEFASALEESTKAAAGKKALSIEATYEDDEGEFYKIHSNGFEGHKRGSQFWAWSEVSLEDEGDKRPSGWGSAGTRQREQLLSPKEIGVQAVAAAMARMGAKKIPTEKMTMIVENRTVGRILGQLMSATSGRALQQKTSFLDGKINEKIGSDLLDLRDDPFVVGGFGSRFFDSEGIAAVRRPVFEKGVLRNYFIDTYYGKKLGMVPTSGGSSNIVITPGTEDLNALISGVEKGVLVRGFIGGNSNETTGDFSLGVYGTLVEKGKLGRAVAELNIAGNHLDLWKRLSAVGSDVYEFSSTRVPSIVFDDVQFAGS